MDELTLYGDRKKDRPREGTRIESPYDLLEYSDTVVAQNIRQTLEKWFQGFPRKHKEELRTRIRKEKEQGVALFELFFYRLLQSVGYDNIRVHTKHGGGLVDFDCLREGELSLSVELRSRYGPAKRQKADRLIRELRSHVDRWLGTEDVLVQFSVDQDKCSPPTYGQFHRFIADFIKGVGGPELLEREIRHDRLPPQRVYTEPGCKITVTLWPKQTTGCAEPGQAVWFPGLAFREDVEAISAQVHDILRLKVKKYEVTTVPFIIALDLQDPVVGERELMDALFGNRGGVIGDGPAPNTAFEKTNLSAVLVFYRFDLRVAARVDAQLIHNPWAGHPYTGPLTVLPQLVREGSNARGIPGKPLGEIIGLPAGWPERLS